MLETFILAVLSATAAMQAMVRMREASNDRVMLMESEHAEKCYDTQTGGGKWG
jgi:hypothetical protein